MKIKVLNIYIYLNIKGVYPLIENRVLPVDGDYTPIFSQYTPNAFFKSKKCKMHLFYNQLNKNKYSFYDNRIENQMILNKPVKEPNVNIYYFYLL